MKKSLFLKIFTGYFLLISILSGTIFFLTFRIIKNSSLETLTNDLHKLGKTVQLYIRPLIEQNRRDELDYTVKKLGQDIETRITVIDNKGVVLADSEEDPSTMENHKTRPEIIRAIYGSMGSAIRYSTTVKEDMLYVALPMRHEGSVKAVVRVSLYLSDVNKTLHLMRNNIVYLSCSIVIIALIVSIIVSGRLTSPVRKLRDAAKRVAAGDFDVRVFLKNNDELYELANSFNYMTGKIRELFVDISSQSEELNNIISSMHEGVLVLDERDGKIKLTNKSLDAITGHKDAEGKFYWEILRSPQFGEIIKKVKQEKNDRIEEVVLDNKTFLCSVSCIEQKGEIVVVLLDISEIKNLEKVKKDFVVNVSHELRTPLTAIKGFVETMAEEVHDTDHQRYLEIIKRHTDRLINIVKDLMVLSKLEREQKLEVERVNVKGILEQARKIYDQRLQEKQLTLSVNVSQKPAPIEADPFKLEQMFINLIDNAIKYTEQGGITIDLTYNDDTVVITVQDTGIGMGQEHLSRIFERFYVVDKSRSRKVGGTGLGLSIVKHIVLLHKGTIDVRSTLGVGTTFTIILPRETA